jgi:chromate transporter
MPDAPIDAPATHPGPGRIRELAKLFTRLGFTAFGGPAAHIAMIEDEVVSRRGWLDRQHLLDLIASINFMPGPNSTQLVMMLGLLRGGYPGLVVAGTCFILPAMLIILPLAWVYTDYGALAAAVPILSGIGAVVAAIVAVVTIRLARSAVRSGSALAFCLIALVLAEGSALGWGPAHGRFQPEIVALALAACWGWFRSRRGQTAVPSVVMLPIAAAPAAGMGAMALFFLKIGATLFGSGYVLISYLQSGLVDQRGWLTQRQLVDAVAVGQFTPGPLLTTATFIGYLLGAGRFAGGVRGGILGGVVATAAIFAPSFVFVALVGPSLQRIRNHPAARQALDNMNAAVAGLLAAVAIRLITTSVHAQAGIDWLNAGMVIAAMIALSRGINASWLILAGGLVGWIGGAR